MPRSGLRWTILLLCWPAASGDARTAAFGKGGAEVRSANGSAVLSSVALDFKVSWACEVRGWGLALTDMSNHTLALWSAADGALARVSLAPLTTPMGVLQSEDGLLYVACFGDYPSPRGASAGSLAYSQTTTEGSYVDVHVSSPSSSSHGVSPRSQSSGRSEDI